MVSVPILSATSDFPPVETALCDPNGLLAIGGDLSSKRLLLAYQQGIFPWFNDNDPILWWSPDPRAILNPAALHIGRSLRKFLRKMAYTVTLNTAFSRVIAHCAQRKKEGSWITPSIQLAYNDLHKKGLAHSVEVWSQDNLIGGLYGVNQGSLFCGESMFSLEINASKVGLVAFCQHFLRHNGTLIDCQIINLHTQSLGAITVSRQRYLAQLAQCRQQNMTENAWEKQTLPLLVG